MCRAPLAAIATAVAFTAIASAQGGGKPATGNPTPGTEQPAPPNVSDRLTFAGCLQAVDRTSTLAADSNAPSDSRFELTKAEAILRGSPGGGPTANVPAPARASSKTYRLEGLDSQFSPFVGARVEITGEVKNAASAAPPTLIVEFVQRIAATCR
jgi:hypothetical protein